MTDVSEVLTTSIIRAIIALNAFIIRAIIALMMEVANTSESSVNFYQTTRRNIPEDKSHLHTRRVRT
jgi:hypothetical protein